MYFATLQKKNILQLNPTADTTEASNQMATYNQAPMAVPSQTTAPAGGSAEMMNTMLMMQMMQQQQQSANQAAMMMQNQNATNMAIMASAQGVIVFSVARVCDAKLEVTVHILFTHLTYRKNPFKTGGTHDGHQRRIDRHRCSWQQRVINRLFLPFLHLFYICAVRSRGNLWTTNCNSFLLIPFLVFDGAGSVVA
jgi:hypothetical protein